MNLEAVLPFMISQVAFRLPILLVWIVAIVFAVQRWKQHPKVSMLVVIAMGTMVLESVTSALVTSSLPLLMKSPGSSATTVSMFMTAYRVVANVVSAACWGAMAVAAFGWRTTPPTAP